MSTPNTIGSVAIPDLHTLMRFWKNNVLLELNCHQVGMVTAFDATKQTASIQLASLRVIGGQAIRYPLLVDVPVFVPAGGDARLTMPVTAGDTCLVLFNDRDLDNWFSSGSGATEPNTERKHSLADGLALVGFRSLANAIPDYSATDAELKNGTGYVSIEKNGGQLELDAKVGLRNAAGKSMLDVMTDIIAALTALNGKTGPSAATQIATAQATISEVLK